MIVAAEKIAGGFLLMVGGEKKAMLLNKRGKVKKCNNTIKVFYPGKIGPEEIIDMLVLLTADRYIGLEGCKIAVKNKKGQFFNEKEGWITLLDQANQYPTRGHAENAVKRHNLTATSFHYIMTECPKLR